MLVAGLKKEVILKLQKLNLINVSDYGANYNKLNINDPITREEMAL